MRKKIMNGIAAIVAAALLLTAALPAFAADDPADGQSPIEIYTPGKTGEDVSIGNAGIEIIGKAEGETSLRITVDGKAAGTAAVAADGSFTAKVGSFALSFGENEVTLVPASGKPSQSVTVKKQNYYDIADLDLKIANAAESHVGEGVSKYCPALSVGGQTVKTYNGFSVLPGDGPNAAPAEATIDLSALSSTVRYFHSVIGVDDFANIAGAVLSSAEYSVLADGKEIAKSRPVTMNETLEISAEIPSGTKKLTLRVSNSNGTNHGDYADWINPRLFLKESDYGDTEMTLFDEETASTLTAAAQVGARVAVKNGFSAVSIKPVKANETVTARIFNFTSTYARSMQNGALCEVSAKADEQGNYNFKLNDLYTSGEYLFVFDGVTEIAASKADNAYAFANGKGTKAALNMTLTFAGKNAGAFTAVSDEAAAAPKGTKATDAEKARAKETYEGYITNLKNFPSKVTIGAKEYVGFGDKDFYEMSRKTTKNATTKSEDTEIVLLHTTSALQFTLKTVYYPDYAAFDWVIYFTNTTMSKSPKVSGLSPAELTFEGENPIILTNCSDSEAVTGTPAPYTPRSYSLEESPNLSFAPTNARSTEAAFPYYNLEYGNKGAFVVTSWAGQWVTDFNYADGKTNFSGRQEVFDSYLKAGETARTPLTAVILYDGRDTDRATNLWRQWFIDCNMFKKDGENNIEPFVAGVTSAVFNEMMGATEQSQIDYIEKYYNIGVNLDLWWMDAGWYEKGGLSTVGEQGWSYVGSWKVNETRFPTKFKAVSEAAAKHNMMTLLWFEPERVAFSMSSSDFDTYGMKRDWLVGYNKDRNSALGPNGYKMFDLSNPEALNWMINRINGVLNEGGISFYREDLNTGSIRDIWRQAESAETDRSGMIENGYVQGHYALWDGILANENIKMIDSCASGGHRLELESMRRAVALHATDYNYNDMPAKHQSTYGLACWLPFGGANTGTGGNVTDTSKYNMRSAYRQSMILQFNVDQLSAEEKTIVANSEKEWRKLSEYFYDDIYELTKNTASANEWYSYGYMNSEEQNGFALVFRHFGNYSPESQTIRLKGLNANDTYEITFADQDGTITATGAELMSTGVLVTLNENEAEGGSDSDVIYIKRTAQGPDDGDDDVMYGDVDASGEVEATDALWALQAYVGSRQLDEKAFKAADVNLDKEVNTSDALAILQYAVKLRDKLPIA